MDFRAIGAITELISATGVIVSLIYLAVQVCQNTRALDKPKSCTNWPPVASMRPFN